MVRVMRQDYPYECVRVRTEGGGWGNHGYRATCPACGVTDTLSAPTPWTPEWVLRRFRQRGWQTHDRHAPSWRCPTCVQAKKAPHKDPTKAEPMTKTSKPDTSPATGGAESAPAPHPALLRDIMIALNDAFDSKAGRWRAGESDATIAASLSCAPITVTTVRRQYFGEESPPDELLQIKSDLAAAKDLIKGLSTRVDLALSKYR